MNKISLGHHTSCSTWILQSYSRLVQRREKVYAFSYPQGLAWALKASHRLLLRYVRSKQTTERKECTFHQIPWRCIIIAPVPHNTTDVTVPQPYLRDGPFITDASSIDSETEQSSAACFRRKLLLKGAPTTQPRRYLMILSRSCHWQRRILSFSVPELSNGTYWITVFELLLDKSNRRQKKAKLWLLGVLLVQRWVMLLSWYRSVLSGYGNFV